MSDPVKEIQNDSLCKKFGLTDNQGDTTMSNWIQLGNDTLLNLDKVWNVFPSGGVGNELRFFVELNFPDPDMRDQGDIWHEVTEQFETKEDMMIAFKIVSQHMGALSLDQAVEDHNKQLGLKNEEEKTSA